MTISSDMKVLKTKGSYSIEELYEQIRDFPFTAGTATLDHHDQTPIINFPAIDTNNQVWIYNASFHKKSQKFYVQKMEPPGLLHLAGDAFFEQLSSDWEPFSQALGDPYEMAELLAERTYEELLKLNL